MNKYTDLNMYFKQSNILMKNKSNLDKKNKKKGFDIFLKDLNISHNFKYNNLK